MMIATKRAPGWSLGLRMTGAAKAHAVSLAGLKLKHLDTFLHSSGLVQKEVIDVMNLPPATLASDQAVKAYVAREKRAIGYIRASAVDASVRVALRLPEQVNPSTPRLD